MSSLSPTSEPRPVAAWVYPLALLAVAVGVGAFVLGLRGHDPAAAWRGLLVNVLFWASLAQGAVLWSTIFRVARTTWSAAVNRVGHAFVRFLPISLLLLGVLYLGRESYLPWLHAPVGDRRWWLNAPFLFTRDAAGLAVLLVLSYLFVRVYRQADGEGESARASQRLSVLGGLLLLAYGWIWSLLGFDLVMSLTPDWHSALFGWYFALGGAYLGLAALVLTSALLRRWLGAEPWLGKGQFRDLGNLLLAFAIAMTYFMYSQALPIWYENLPPEVVFAIPRVHLQPWVTLSWVLLFTCYLGVFASLVVREVKERPVLLGGVATLALAGMWLERYLLVVPSLVPKAPPFPGVELLIGLGFLGLLVLTVLPALARRPVVSELDLALKAEQEVWL